MDDWIIIDEKNCDLMNDWIMIDKNVNYDETKIENLELLNEDNEDSEDNENSEDNEDNEDKVLFESNLTEDKKADLTGDKFFFVFDTALAGFFWHFLVLFNKQSILFLHSSSSLISLQSLIILYYVTKNNIIILNNL